MSLRVLKPGLLDTLQDQGRHGWAHRGINPGGAMDSVALAVANFLVGNQSNEAVLEIHFPAPRLTFESDALFALAGADFAARLDSRAVPAHTPVFASAGSILEFSKPASGVRCYLAIAGGFDVAPWLGSRSTHLAVQAGGFMGRALQSGDVLPFRRPADWSAALKGEKCRVLPWKANISGFYPAGNRLRFCPGPEYESLNTESKQLLEKARWKIGPKSNRMGYRAEGPALTLKDPLELASSGVVPGTIQLLPNGQFILLMADCQTTGGYPRIGHIISADLPGLAQMQPGDTFYLQSIDLEQTFHIKAKFNAGLRRLQMGCRLLANYYQTI